MKNKSLSLVIIILLLAAPIFTSGMDSSSPQIQGPERVPSMASPSKLSPLAITAPGTPADLAEAMGIGALHIISASLNGSDVLGTGIGTTPLGNFFPTEGSTYAILSTGLAESADDPNDEGSLSFALDGLNNSQGEDLTQLALTLHVPPPANCVTFDFTYYSEEFPEFVGSQFNDAFTAELGGTNLTIVNDQVVAPLNFAFDSGGNVISVNTVFGVTLGTGTTYDGGTSLLRARAPVTPDSMVDIVFSVQDLGDSIYDSAVFLDNFVYSTESTCDNGAISSVFFDVPYNYWAWSWIEDLYGAGITGGCASNPLQYCPNNNVTRAEMSVFLERGIHGSSFTPPNVAPTFTDTVGHWAEDWIEALLGDGITSGCGPGTYCPDAFTTRAEMAVFLLRSEHGASYTPPAVGGSTGFTDVPTSYWAASWIKQLAAEGITTGCAPNLYCPEATVTRAQMAVFLVRTFMP